MRQNRGLDGLLLAVGPVAGCRHVSKVWRNGIARRSAAGGRSFPPAVRLCDRVLCPTAWLWRESVRAAVVCSWLFLKWHRDDDRDW